MSLTDPATQLAAAFSVGNMLSYIARASRTRRARSSSRFGINWTNFAHLLSKAGNSEEVFRQWPPASAYSWF